MLFNTTDYFLIFTPLVILTIVFWTYGIGYFIRKKKNIVIIGRNILLLLASLFFYGYWRLSFLPVLLGSILFNYFIGSLIVNPKLNYSNKIRFIVFIVGVSMNVILLGLFKYIDFAIQNIAQLFVWMHYIAVIPAPYHWTLPLGISFFTFQQIAYLADCYKEKNNCRSIVDYSLFVAFWPQLIAGPIVHHREMITQFGDIDKLHFKNPNIIVGICIFLIGITKKMLVADPLGAIANFGYINYKTLAPYDLWSMSYAYTLQLYFDFSGYCDMAIGSALLFNFTLPINFNSPYWATSIQDFWRRWHITLSVWLRDYIYIPLGGNRCGNWKHYRNLLLTFLLVVYGMVRVGSS